jgi:hypothetical protein
VKETYFLQPTTEPAGHWPGQTATPNEQRPMRAALALLMALTSMAFAEDGFQEWKKRLPREAKAFRDADDIYWRQWYKRGFSPAVAWKNTDPKAVHTFARPQFVSER